MKITFITGSGVSQESGIPTYRDTSDGLWMNYDIEKVSTAEAWINDPATVLEFHNLIRKKLDEVKPNDAHRIIADLSLADGHDVWVVTQNVDDLHERAGSPNVLHLHGQLRQSRSSVNPALVFPYDKDIEIGDEAPDGSQLRPNVVWFGEDVPAMGIAALKVARADVVVVVGTSLAVYPAAGLLEYVRDTARIFVIDPAALDEFDISLARAKTGIVDPVPVEHIKMVASKGMKKLIKFL
jgi:NAD-dependent deacetylase